MADKRAQIARQHEDNRKHGSPVGAVWIAIAIIIALIVVIAMYWGEHDSKTASKNASHTTGFYDQFAVTTATP